MICLVNPTARSGRGRTSQAFWRQGLSEAGLQFRWHECRSGEDCRVQAGLATERTVVTVGGDGTINNVRNGLMANPSRPALGVLYSGTSPDFCTFHRIPTKPEAALARLRAGRPKAVDVAEIRFPASETPGAADAARTAFFASSCDIGLGAATAEFANRWRRHLGYLAPGRARAWFAPWRGTGPLPVKSSSTAIPRG